MKKLITICLVVCISLVSSASANIFVPGNSTVRYSAYADGFFVNSAGLDLYGATAWASAYMYSGVTPLFGIQAGADSGSYSDAGIVLYFDGSLTLGQLGSVTISTTGGNTTPIINLWLDSGNDHQFFAFNGEAFTGLAGDAYFGATVAGNINGSTTFSYLGGPGAYGEYTLSQLQAGTRSGIDANTKVALWVGLTNGPSYSDYNYANITQVEVSTIPEPATMMLLGLGVLMCRKFKKA